MVTHSRSSLRRPLRGCARRAWIGVCCGVLLAISAHAGADEGAADTAASEVVMRALSFLGVPYRRGGEDPARGFDCSGLVRNVIRSALEIELPRHSDAMSAVGRSVAPELLAPGDLLFFNTLGRPFSHVAVYIGEGRFVHAPARGGSVRVESMRLDYWRARFNGARRLASSAEIRPARSATDFVSRDHFGP
jgi:cell wall-associated NlpC family hydrolase